MLIPELLRPEAPQITSSKLAVVTIKRVCRAHAELPSSCVMGGGIKCEGSHPRTSGGDDIVEICYQQKDGDAGEDDKNGVLPGLEYLHDQLSVCSDRKNVGSFTSDHLAIPDIADGKQTGRPPHQGYSYLRTRWDVVQGAGYSDPQTRPSINDVRAFSGRHLRGGPLPCLEYLSALILFVGGGQR